MTVSAVIAMWQQGFAPEEIQTSFPHHSLREVYGTILRSFEYQEELDALFREQDARYRRLKAESEAQHPAFYADTRERVARFRSRHSIDDLAREQHVPTVNDVTVLAMPDWPDDESVDDVVTFIRGQRAAAAALTTHELGALPVSEMCNRLDAMKKYDRFPGFERCLKMMRSHNGSVREDGFGWLAERAVEYLPQLIAAFWDVDNAAIRGGLIELIGEAKSAAAMPFLVERLRDEDESIRSRAAWALKRLDTKDARTALWQAGLTSVKRD